MADSIIRLSKSTGCRASQIYGYEIYQDDNNVWVVKWETEQGTKKSNSFPSLNKANEYVNDMIAAIHVCEEEEAWKQGGGEDV